MKNERGWGPLLHHWGKDFQLLLFVALSLQLFRLVLLAVFGEQASHATPQAILLVVGNGLRYDISTAGAWVLPTFLLSLTVTLLPLSGWIDRLRRFSATLFAVTAVLIFGVDLVYFDEYNDQFNQHLFGIVHDDTVAILITIWKEYHPLLFGALVLPLLAVSVWLVRRWMAWTPRRLAAVRPQTHGWTRKLGFGIGLFLLFTAAVRGGTLWGEPIRLKHAFVVNDLFLNRVVVNPFTALRYTLESHFEAQRRGGFSALWKGGLADAVRTAIGRTPAPGEDLDTLLTRHSRGAPNPPRHLFLILNESHSGWTVMPAYRHLGFSPELSRLAEQGLYFPNFLPAAHGTVGSMNALLTGLPDAGLNINYEAQSLHPYPSGVAALFKRLGYKTRFFYGGFLSWQRLDSFAQAQGFDEVYGGGSMAAGDADGTNEWGVDDAFLFDFVLDTVRDEGPSFNFILTTSNHPPYDLDLQGLGFPFSRLPEPLTATKGETLKVLGHLWYSDQQLGRFVRAAESVLDRPLFAITGDHTSRLGIRFPGDSVVEQYAVPFVLYGPQVLAQRGQRDTAGSHVDIPPTLVELTAPEGFPYVSFGQDLLQKPSPSYGQGYEFLIGETFIASHGEPPRLWRLPDHRDAELPSPESLIPVARRFSALKALSWYRARRGSELPTNTMQATTVAR